MTRAVLVLATLAALCGAPSSLRAASPDPTPQAAPSDAPSQPGSRDGSTGTPGPAPSVEPRPAKSGKPTAQPSPDEAPSVGGPSNRDGRRGRATGGSRPGRGDRSQPAPAASGSPALAVAAPSPSMVDDERMLQLGLVVGVSALLLLGSGWLLAAQGREPGPAELAARRARRARGRADRAAAHDPVLAALGLDDDDPAPPAGSA